MAKKNWVRLAGSPQVLAAAGDPGIFSSVDLSAYVDPLRNKGFLVTSVKMAIMMDTTVNGLIITGGTSIKSFALQMATGTQSTATGNLRPSDGKVMYHNFGSYINDADGGPYQLQTVEWNVTDLWPGGYYCVVDTLTASVVSSADFAADTRMTYSLAGYQVSISSNQLASFLVAQTQN
jgi:hypothetical protein